MTNRKVFFCSIIFKNKAIEALNKIIMKISVKFSENYRIVRV